MQSTKPDRAPVVDTGLRQYLTFRLGGLEYALDYDRVRELRPLKSLERVASRGDLVPGVAVSHGLIMPIVDMRVAFGPRPPQHDPRTEVIILKLSTCVMGMVTDGVSDVVTLAPGDILPFGSVGKDVDYLLGIGAQGTRRMIVLDIDKLMAIKAAQIRRASADGPGAQRRADH
ncbi:MAG TPA: chemotaxis protein CheW [Pseudoduganella sp.]